MDMTFMGLQNKKMLVNISKAKITKYVKTGFSQWFAEDSNLVGEMLYHLASIPKCFKG
jgi:hypothetical protein